MNSIKTKTNNYSIGNAKAIAGIVLIPENGKFRGYVAWEWEDEAKGGFFSITESLNLFTYYDIDYTLTDKIADFGRDVTHLSSARKLFPTIF